MSHVADCNIEVRDLNAFEQAVKALGGELIRGQQTFRWYGRFLNDWQSDRAAVNRRDPATFGKCEHAVKFPGINYEVGLQRNADGSFTPVYDNYGGYGSHDGQKLERIIGVGGAKLKDEYGCAVTMRMMARKGFRVARQVDAKTGEVLAVCRR